MAIFFDAPVDPDDLTTFVREVPVNRGGQTRRLLSMFGTRQVDRNEVDFAQIVKTNRVARFRSWDGRIHVSTRDTGSEKRVPLPPVSTSLNMGEYERLQLEFARTGGTEPGRARRVDLQRRRDPHQRGPQPAGSSPGVTCSPTAR
jgi:hypothetical protein